MNGFKRDIKPKEDMNMKKNTETAKIPMINQVLKDTQKQLFGRMY